MWNSWKPTAMAATMLALGGLLLTGCDDAYEGDKEATAEAALGIEEGTHVESTDIDTRRIKIEKEQRVRDAETGEVIGRHIETTPVTVTEETRVEREVEVESGDTVVTEQGEVPAEIHDDHPRRD